MLLITALAHGKQVTEMNNSKLYHNLNIHHELVEDINDKQAEKYYIH